MPWNLITYNTSSPSLSLSLFFAPEPSYSNSSIVVFHLFLSKRAVMTSIDVSSLTSAASPTAIADTRYSFAATGPSSSSHSLNSKPSDTPSATGTALSNAPSAVEEVFTRLDNAQLSWFHIKTIVVAGNVLQLHTPCTPPLPA